MKKYLLLFGACIVLGSCSTGDNTAPGRMLGGSSQALSFLDYKSVSENEVEFTFSEAVTVKNVSFSPDIDVVSIENGSMVRVKLAVSPEPGRLITANLVAEDEKRNSINVLVSFRARNNRMPKLVVNELCTEYASASAGKKEEFIEFKTKTAGNLGAMRVFIVGNSNAARETIYEFPTVEVKAGEYVVLHLRTFNPDSKDELSGNLAESPGVNASNEARDFWIPGEAKLLHKTSFVYVLDQDDNVLCAALLCENPGSPWPKDYFAETANYLFTKGAWDSEDGTTYRPSDAVSTAGATNTRTICRDETVENTNSKNDWYITATSSATPGGLNNPKRY